jgi:hypothetical protein
VPLSTYKVEPKPDSKADTKQIEIIAPKPDAQAQTKQELNAKPAAEVSPQLVNRVHKFYEQLGRENVRAVEESDRAKQKTPEPTTKK